MLLGVLLSDQERSNPSAPVGFHMHQGYIKLWFQILAAPSGFLILLNVTSGFVSLLVQ